jgi:UDP-2-acetamido-2-deoxy-ribo-hexuluronate aminotransferase
VFTTPFTFVATGEVISLLRATPVFVDVDPRTFNIDPAELRRAIERCDERGMGTPKGIITVDLFGLPCDYDAITSLAEQHGLFLLEDAAQSFGAEFHGRRACGLGHVGATSFFPAKPLGCYGDGGAIFTDDDDLADRLRSIRIHGQGSDKYDNIRTGLNARLDTLQAAILLPKLAAFPHELHARQRVAERYTDLLEGYVETPRVPDHSRSAWAQYSVLSDRREVIQKGLKNQGIPTAVYYTKPLHLQSAYAHLGYRVGDFPNAEVISQRILSLPMHPYLTNEQIDIIVSAVVASLRS